MKHRLTGAFVWLGLLVIVVPIWYNNPVNFNPEAEQASPERNQKTLVADKPFLIPEPRGSEQTAANAEKAESVSAPEPDVALPRKPSSTAASASKESANVSRPSSETAEAKPQAPTKVASNSVETADESESEWIIRLVAYRHKDMADGLHERLKYDYEAYVKYFPDSRYYSVRVGPYASKQQALKDQKRLDGLLRIQSQLVRFKRTP